jgi:hypothetical protein
MQGVCWGGDTGANELVDGLLRDDFKGIPRVHHVVRQAAECIRFVRVARGSFHLIRHGKQTRLSGFHEGPKRLGCVIALACRFSNPALPLRPICVMMSQRPLQGAGQTQASNQE